ncbi:hypothetical protein MNBD_GAMMA06-900 [hydrothermal vent metagenome]|uniref:CheR-type methyltransferase domain-containing protein n=1 Tax=hydrothermal vent metagenome TaxID=652676 RepID=A0A3B0WLJ1_9ZZZZ
MPTAAPHNIDDYESLLVALQNVLGVVVSDTQRSGLVERVEPLMAHYNFDSLASLAERLQDVQAEDIKSSVLEAISQRHSDWLFNSATLNILQDYVFAQLPVEAKIWLVGCGQGQLAYALAMEIAEYENKSGESKNFQILASDSSQQDIKLAESASYYTRQLKGLSDVYKKTYMAINSLDGSAVVQDKVRQNTHFSQCDLTENFQAIGEMDLIICPETLVYFSNGVKENIIQQFISLLKSGGVFLTGNPHAMITPLTKGFERVEHPAGIFYRQKN